MTLRNDSAFVVSTLSDSLWTVDLRDGHVLAARLIVPGYVKPALPQKMQPGPRGLTEWTKTFHMPVTIYSTDRSLYVPFVQGVLNFGDPTLLVQGTPNDGWQVFRTCRPLVGASGTTLTTIADPNAVRITLRVYAENQ
jgi:hypothetical protein